MKTLIKFFITLILYLIFSSQIALSSDKIKIGLIVPLSGEYSDIGSSIIKSVRLAINNIDDERIEIVPKDTKNKDYQDVQEWIADGGTVIDNGE